MFCAAWWVSIKFSTFNQGCATTFMRSPLAPMLKEHNMTIEQVQKDSAYLFYCKSNYKNGVRPSGTDSKNTEGYLKLVEIAKLYFENNLQNKFAEYFAEGSYHVQLWTAHLILDFGQPDLKLEQLCLDEIKKYSANIA
jgi:hypothetical protein